MQSLLGVTEAWDFTMGSLQNYDHRKESVHLGKVKAYGNCRNRFTAVKRLSV